MPSEPDTSRNAHLHRMVMPGHLCPYGLKSRDLLQREGYRVIDHPLRSREETDAFMRRNRVETTPQTFIDGDRIGGYDDLRAYFGDPLPGRDETSYRPVIAIFATALLVVLAFVWATAQPLVSLRVLEWFVAVFMTLLGLQKLQDVESFSTMFLNYDLLARRWVRYGYIYPFAETGAGLLMIAGALLWLAAPVALLIGTIGAVSVIKAVYVDRRALKCACVGGDSNVPLGPVSLTENLMMAGIGLWMLLRLFA